MSSFIVEDSCINRILGFLQTHTLEWAYKGAIEDFFEAEGIDPTAEGCAKELGRRIKELNVEAWCWRYDEMVPDITFDYAPIHSTDPLEAIKAIDCLTYQCSEGDFDKKPLFLHLEQLAWRISHCFVQLSKEYDEKPWGK